MLEDYFYSEKGVWRSSCSSHIRKCQMGMISEGWVIVAILSDHVKDQVEMK